MDFGGCPKLLQFLISSLYTLCTFGLRRLPELFGPPGWPGWGESIIVFYSTWWIPVRWIIVFYSTWWIPVRSITVFYSTWWIPVRSIIVFYSTWWIPACAPPIYFCDCHFLSVTPYGGSWVSTFVLRRVLEVEVSQLQNCRHVDFAPCNPRGKVAGSTCAPPIYFCDCHFLAVTPYGGSWVSTFILRRVLEVEVSRL